jgi:hypothetical protein
LVALKHASEAFGVGMVQSIGMGNRGVIFFLIIYSPMKATASTKETCWSFQVFSELLVALYSAFGFREPIRSLFSERQEINLSLTTHLRLAMI